LRVVEHEQFQKLDRIRQLGPAYLVYPGATHTRRSHSLGVFHLARRMIITLVRRNSVVPISLEGVKAFLCAALLHDIGHYPFAHSLKDLAPTAHESLAARQILEDFAPAIRGSLHAEPQAVAAIIDRHSPYAGNENVGFYAKLLSGVLDPDKLDYLNRDAFFCGVPYGIQDVDFILEEVYPHPGNGVAISRKGITALENILFSKFLMYKTVYWHKTVRIATAMIKKAIALSLGAGAIRAEDLYGLDDEEFFLRFTDQRFPGARLIEDTRKRLLHKQVYRAAFRDDEPAHRRLESIDARLLLEERIAKEAGKVMGVTVSPECIVVDVPERLSFELSIPVIDPGRPEDTGHAAGDAAATGSVFDGIGREDFPRTLRTISVNVRRDPELLSAIERIDLSARISA
jgi:HD superfamily phosphohydrolase